MVLKVDTEKKYYDDVLNFNVYPVTTRSDIGYLSSCLIFLSTYTYISNERSQ